MLELYFSFNCFIMNLKFCNFLRTCSFQGKINVNTAELNLVSLFFSLHLPVLKDNAEYIMGTVLNVPPSWLCPKSQYLAYTDKFCFPFFKDSLTVTNNLIHANV